MIYLFNLKKYKNNGKFVAVVNPNDAMWQTKENQEYLKNYYSLEEAYLMGLVTSDEKELLQCELAHPGEQCPWSQRLHYVTKDEVDEYRAKNEYYDGMTVANAENYLI